MKQLLFSVSMKTCKMRQQYLRIMLVLLAFFSLSEAKSQYDFSAMNEDGLTLYYSYINDGKELELARESYKKGSIRNYEELYGKVLRIPAEVTHQGRTRKVTQIQEYALAYAGMTEVVLPPTMKKICPFAFYHCDVKVLNIPDNIETIDQKAFSVVLDRLTVGKGLKKVESGNFIRVDSLIVDDIRSFLEIDFQSSNFFDDIIGLLFDSNYTLITDLIIPEGFTKIGKSIRGCQSIRSVRIPNSITEIDDNAFSECRNLSNVYYHDNIIKIGEHAFSACSITSIKLPENLIIIDDYAFYNCPLSEIVIPNKVEEIHSDAFSRNHYQLEKNNLQLVVLPQSLKVIGSQAFDSGDGLLTVISNIENPALCPAGNYANAFNKNTLMNATLYIPVGTKSAYESAKGWKDFVYMEEGIPTISQITITTSNDGYATFYDSKSAYILPSGLSAYTISGIKNNILQSQKIDGSIVPRGVPVILVSASKASNTYTLTSTDRSVSYSGTNYLRGSDSDANTTGDGYHYKLCYGDGSSSNVFGWYWGTDNGGSFAINGHKAWLVIPKSEKAPTRSIIMNNNNK